jgi:hypothetical protein
LGIGTDNPTTELEVLGTGTVASFRGKGGSSFIGIKDEDDGTLVFIGVDGGTLKFQTSGSSYSDKLIIDTSGRVTKPYQPAFFAYPNTGSSLGGVQTYVFSLTQFNIGSHYSTATGRFTAPVAGVYHFDYGVQHNASVSDNLAVDLNVNNSQYSSVVRIEVFTSSTFHIVTASATIYLNASDFVTIASITGTAWGDNSWFSGHHVG